MKFYRVIKEDKTDYFNGYTTVKGELLTEKERKRNFRYLPDDVFEEVEISKKNTFWIFGCRFECRK